MARETSAPAVRIRGYTRLLDYRGFLRVDEYKVSYWQPRTRGWKDIASHVTVDRRHSVAAILHDPSDDMFHFVRQFRFSTYDVDDPLNPQNGWLVELVAGAMRDNETNRECLIREVAEETGFQIEDPVLVGSFFLTPGASSERLFLFFAQVSEARRAPPQNRSGTYGIEGEEIELVRLSLDAFLGAVERLEVADAKTIVAAEYLRRRFKS